MLYNIRFFFFVSTDFKQCILTQFHIVVKVERNASRSNNASLATLYDTPSAYNSNGIWTESSAISILNNGGF